MNKDAENKLKEVLSLVKQCPDHIQEKCFELLFEYFFTKKSSLENKAGQNPEDDELVAPETKPKEQHGDEITQTDIHTKVKALIKRGDITLEDLNNLFYKEEGDFKALFDDLHTTKMSDSQIRLALLEALKNAMKDGDFKFSATEVKELCDAHKCYDSPNFASNFKKNASLFTDKYQRSGQMNLSSDGKKELVKIVTEIAR